MRVPVAVVADHGVIRIVTHRDSQFVERMGLAAATCAELGIPVRDYPYYSVICDYCHRHPHAWTSNISTEDAANLQPGENGRLRLARQLGWKTVLSNSYTTHAGDGEVILEGVGVGHGLGLCQRGAADMARRGASWEQILQHYYPNTVVIAVPQTALRY